MVVVVLVLKDEKKLKEERQMLKMNLKIRIYTTEMEYMQITCENQSTNFQTSNAYTKEMYLEYEVHGTSTKGPQQYRAVVSLQNPRKGEVANQRQTQKPRGGSGGDENTRSEVILSERGGNEPITPRRHRTWNPSWQEFGFRGYIT
ncbi:hypothetical protein RHMOL_Rhmol12G0143400 [Rhododendron molle]|uniref:Uncharacterized protein n=1 Tax=Rhododendron molle TaxID=49168 RepID=A0ACC0LJ82_RHOML|nr:hypothetical protein RHMOL_Rhmol12G0143400 [Rhododendron molle]